MSSVKLTFQSRTETLCDVRASVREFLAETALSEEESQLVVLALDEACTNIIRHAYGNACKTIRMEMQKTPGKIRFILRDYGKSCDPGKIRGRRLEEIRPGGLGVHIIRQAFDRVVYEPCSRGTRLTMERAI